MGFKIQNQGFDHVEFAVRDLATHSRMWERMGFELAGERHLPSRGIKSKLYAQGYVRVILTASDGSQAGESEKALQFQKKHGDGICVLGVDVDNATRAFEETTKRGARPALEPVRYESAQGTVIRSEIWTPEDFRYAFIERATHAARGYPEGGPRGPALFDDGLHTARLESPSPTGLRVIDHLTNNVDMGEMKRWVEWYKQVFGFVVSRHFDIRTGRTGLTSDVVQSEDGRIKVPINQATEKESQVQEFVDRFKGAGVQHLALLSTGIAGTVGGLRKAGFKFLGVPHTYYEVVPTRVPGVTESLQEMEDLGVLLDGDDSGYLLQIFSEELVGPFFLEFIQRKGNKGFGEGNFRALFEAIERDQIKRGVLKA